MTTVIKRYRVYAVDEETGEKTTGTLVKLIYEPSRNHYTLSAGNAKIGRRIANSIYDKNNLPWHGNRPHIESQPELF